MEIVEVDRPLDPPASSALLAKMGFPTAVPTLAKYRCIGGGPTYLKYGHSIRYRPSDLKAWVEGRCRLQRSTSDTTHYSQNKTAI